MPRRSHALALLTALFGTTCALAIPAPWESWQSPELMARLDASMASFEVSSFCSDNCRYDRLGRGNESPVQNPYPERWLYRDGDEVVLFDDPGAGVVTRIWLASGGPVATCLDETLRVKFHFGGSPVPTLDLPLARLFDGSTLPFTPPLVFDRDQGSGGYASYVPIAYADGLRIALSGIDRHGPCSLATPPSPPRLWYQIDAQRLPPGAVAADFSPALGFTALHGFLAAAGEDPWARGLAPVTEALQLAPGEAHVASADGSGWLAGLRVRAEAETWAGLALEIDADGEPILSLPLDAAFGVNMDDVLPMRSPLLGQDASGWLYSWWPLPFRHGVRVKLRNDAATTVALELERFVDPMPPPAGAARPFARAWSHCGDGGASHEHRLLELAGSGRLMMLGGRFAASVGADARYLEGDTRIRLDGGVAPTWPGSGLEDFYNGGFYFDWGRPYRQALSGAARVDVDGASRMWRLLLADAPAFAHGIEVLQEAGASPAEVVPMCMDTVARGYRRQARSLVPVARLEAGDPAAVARYGYAPAAGADCASLEGRFSDAAASARSARVCRSTGGESRFRMKLAEAAPVLRLRRVVDAATPGQAAQVRINGVPAGSFPPVRPDAIRRWQEQDAPLAVPPGATVLDIRIEPMWGAHGDAGVFTESSYELWATPGDLVFGSGFEASWDARRFDASR
ncbi:MAG: DUF2961 domain-containing protein [Xanthomonadales bacterium]|nr:DUF2961 domain-containing protein [Xanthomonadales bacterium]